MNILTTTGISKFISGEALTADKLNRLNDTINALVNTVNYLLKDTCDINQELNSQEPLSLEKAIKVVTESMGRRMIGMKIRFINLSGNHVEYFYIGPDVSDSEWNSVVNWELFTPAIIDGGTW